MKRISIFVSFLLLSTSLSIGQNTKNVSLNMNDDEMFKVHYYHKGKKIPLSLNEDKICVSIPKDNNKASDIIVSNIKYVEKANDNSFDFFVLHRTEYEKLIISDFWKQIEKVVITTPSYKTSNNKELFASPYLSIKLKKEQDIDKLTSYADKLGLVISKQVPLTSLWYILHITPDSEKTTLECANELWESGEFAASVPDFCADNLTCSNDPYYNMQWGLHNSYFPYVDISAEYAWNYATGKNVKIAILDSGVDMNHVDLSPNISSLSYDTETGSSPSVVYDNHGTHCAGIAAAVKDNGIFIAGVAPEAKIVSISNKMEVSLGTPEKLATGIRWAYQNGVDIISNSWNYPTPHDDIEEAIQEAFKYGRQGKGCVIVFASGNDSCSFVGYPANCNDTILTVGSIMYDGEREPDSNYGLALDLVAPGVGILSTIPYNYVSYNSGTSMACPHVAGVAALILERNPELTVSQVNSIINSNAKKISGVNFNISKTDGLWNNEYGYGLVDAYSSVINTPSLVYIQNETITGTSVITAGNICVGRDVTETKPYGDVVLGQGVITLKADCIEIRNSTTVPLGTTLSIEN